MEPQLPCAHTTVMTSVVGDSCRAQLVSPEAEEPEEATNFFPSNLQVVLYREETWSRDWGCIRSCFVCLGALLCVVLGVKPRAPCLLTEHSPLSHVPDTSL